MDLYAIIRELQIEKQKLDRIIKALEKLGNRTSPDGKVPGPSGLPKCKGGDERREVSERMRIYWAHRREK